MKRMIANGRRLSAQYRQAKKLLADVDAVPFLGSQEREGVQIANCSRFVREWIQREQTTTSTALDKAELTQGEEGG